MKAPKTTGNFEKHPIGQYAAVLTAIIDTGTHLDKVDHPKRKVSARFVTTELMEDQRPFMVSNSFNFTMYENSHLSKFVQNITGKPMDQEQLDDYDLKDLLGVNALITIVHNDKYVNIQSAVPLPDAMPKAKAIETPYIFDIEKPDMAVFGKFSEKMQNWIKEAQEWGQSANESQKTTGDYTEANPPPMEDDFIDDISF